MISTMINVDSGSRNRRGNGDARKTRRSASFCSPGRHKISTRPSPTKQASCSTIGMGRSSSRPFPVRQATFSAVVKVSKMQASFAERTATEMEEIVDWYKKYEGIERLKKKNQQRKSMPDNAMIVVDDSYDDSIDEEETGANGANQKGDQQPSIEVTDEERVLIKDFSNPMQKRKTIKGIGSNKIVTASLVSAVRSISKASKCDDHPPPAIQISIDLEDESLVSRSTPTNADSSMKWEKQSIIDTVTQDLILESQEQKEIVIYPDKTHEVLAMLSPSGCAELQAQTLIETTDGYNDEEEEVLAMLSPITCSSKSILSIKPTAKSIPSLSPDSISTGQEAQSQIEAAADLIRNTQNMAEIISQLQHSSPTLSMDDDDDNSIDASLGWDSVSMLSSRDQETSDTTSAIKKKMHIRLQLGTSGKDCTSVSHSMKETKLAFSKIYFGVFQVRQIYQFLLPFLVSLAIAFALNLVKA